MGIDIDFLNESISESYSDTITTDTKNTYSYNFQDTVTIPCDSQKAADGVGLWQYIVTTADGTGATWTTHTVCRYGANYNVEPACPWNACDDGECTTCKSGWNK